MEPDVGAAPTVGTRYDYWTVCLTERRVQAVLLELTIHNLAVIRDMRITFGPGLNALTGETGAGKSMVIDALGAVLGARTSAEIVRSGTSGAWVEAVFDISHNRASDRILATLADAGIEQSADEPVILSREISTAGRSTARIANRTVTAAVLSRVGELLVDIHGQSDHLSLLKPVVQLEMLDHFANADRLRQALTGQLQDWRRLRAQIHDFDEDQRSTAQRLDLLKFQSDELFAVNPQPNEDERLQHERARLTNAERLLHSASDAQTSLAGDSTIPNSAGAIDLVRTAARLIGDIAALDPSFEPALLRTNDVIFALEEIAGEVRDYAERIDLDPRRLEEVEERLELLHRMKRKYGPSLANVLEHAAEISFELAQLETTEHDIDALRAEEEQLRRRLGVAAAELSSARKAAAEHLSRAVERSIHELNMGRAAFEVRFDIQQDDDGVILPSGERVVIDPTGIDRVTFFLATNRGEELRPLARVASGGETARLMLALKSILSSADETPVLVFDEVDVGVGGRSGQVVGEKLWELTARHQAIVISHLPQIAAFADHHVTLIKQEEDERTVTLARDVTGDARVDEVAAMLDGLPITPESRASARALLLRATDWKASRRSLRSADE